MDIEIGQVINDRYRIVKLLGRGGMAEVYKVWDETRGIHLAMKILRDDLAEDKVFLRRFQREAQMLAELQHPNIVRFYGLERVGKLVFMLMEYIDGTTLRAEIAEANHPFDRQKVLEIIEPVCRALNYAHRMGRIHCDVKPANIMIDKSGKVQLTDFGVARMMDTATMTMAGVGTPAYMAPEVIRGKDPTQQTDIYSLGLVMYEMLAGGERPFTGEKAKTTGSTGEKVRWEHVYATPPLLRKFNPKIDPGLEAVVMKCLEKDVSNRYQSIGALVEALQIKTSVDEEVRPQPVRAEPAPRPAGIKPAPKMRKTPALPPGINRSKKRNYLFLIALIPVLVIAGILINGMVKDSNAGNDSGGNLAATNAVVPIQTQANGVMAPITLTATPTSTLTPTPTRTAVPVEEEEEPHIEEPSDPTMAPP